jgi:hypothetical protein
MLDRRGQPLPNKYANLRWQTALTALIERKSFFAALANRAPPRST